MASAHTPVKNVCYSCGSPGYKPHWLLELGILGACPLGGVLRVVVVNVGSTSSTLQGEVGIGVLS